MKSMGVTSLVNRGMVYAAFTLLAVIAASGSLNPISAQSSGNWAVARAQQAVRQQIVSREGGRGSAVVFNNDTQSESVTNTSVRVSGSGRLSNNGNSRNSRGRGNNTDTREFTYEALVTNSGRNRGNAANVSDIRYEWQGNRFGRDRDNDGRGGDFRGQSIYCASEDGRRRTCAVNTSSGNVRLLREQSQSACVEGRTWGFNRDGIWVDRGCRAYFEVGGDGRRGNNGPGVGNDGGFLGGDRPNGQVRYSGPIMNRHSDKALDVSAQSLQDGANIQQWGYAGQPNQNWDVIDLGNNEIAIISRHSGKALTVQGGRDSNGSNIIQRNWSGNTQQRWRMEQVGGDYYRIVSVDNGKCLDVTAEGRQDGANIQIWDYSGQSNQQWRFKR